MSTTKKVTKLNKKAAYFQQYKIPKKLVIWVPPSVEEYFIENQDELSIMELVYFIEANNVERIDTETYQNDFQEFYNFHLQHYENEETFAKFCSNVEGGVADDYIIHTANGDYGEDNITILSVENMNFDKIYALISFRLASSDTVMVETLCGNQTINSEGEGTRLLNFLKKMSYSIGIPKIALHPVDTAVSYYTRENFRKLKSDEAAVINTSSDEDEDSPQKTMAYNQRARHNWAKIKGVTRVLGMYTRNKQLNELLNKTKEIKRFYKSKYDEKTGKKGTPIPYPFSTQTTTFIPRSSLVGELKKVVRTDEGTVKIVKKVPITPGDTLKNARLKDKIEYAAQMTKIQEENAKLEAEAKAKASKTKKSSKKASGTRKRKNKRRK
jgi:hypothetical protein